MLLSTIRIFVKRSLPINTTFSKVNKISQINVIRNYAGKFSRQPIAIVNEDELFDAPDSDKIKARLAKKDHRLRMKKKKSTKKNPVDSGNLESTETKTNFTKVHDNAKLLWSTVLEAKCSSKKKKKSKMVLEGHRLITDAIIAGIIPEAIIYNNKKLLEKLPSLTSDVKFYKVPYKTLQLWSSVTTSPGIMGIFPKPNVNLDPPKYAIPLTMICDNIRDPGNMGTLIRTAAAVGCEQLILTKGCVDIWDHKVLRSAAGSHFRLPIHVRTEWENINKMIDTNAEIFAADIYDFSDSDVEDEEQIVDGSDAYFDSTEEYNTLETDENESLDNEHNKNEFLKDDFDEDDLSDNTDENDLSDNTDENDKTKNAIKKKKFSKNSEIIESLKKSIPVYPYYSIDYTAANAVLIVGGETEGLSEEALTLLQSRDGARVNIPVYNEVESLNTSMAAGIIAYEINRQYNTQISDESQQENEDKAEN